MPRTTKGNLAAKKHKAVLARTKGHYGARSRLFKTAKQSLIKSLQYAYRDRKNRKRDFNEIYSEFITEKAMFFASIFDFEFITFLKKMMKF